MSEAIVLCLAVTVYLATAVYTDVRMHRIPNWVTVPSAVLGLVYHTVVSAWNGNGVWSGAGVSLAGFALGSVLLILPWLFGGGGMGDVKLLAALGAWLGPKWLIMVFIVSMLLASAMVIAVFFYSTVGSGYTKTRRKLLPGRRGTTEAGKGRRRFLPFAVPLAVGTVAVLAWLVCTGTL
jgi:prepilin peptidase CpaA